VGPDDLTEPEFNMVDGTYTPTTASTTAEVLQLFDGKVKTIRELLAARTDADLMSTWTFKQNGQELFGMPRARPGARGVMNHLIHHRAS